MEHEHTNEHPVVQELRGMAAKYQTEDLFQRKAFYDEDPAATEHEHHLHEFTCWWFNNKTTPIQRGAMREMYIDDEQNLCWLGADMLRDCTPDQIAALYTEWMLVGQQS